MAIPDFLQPENFTNSFVLGTWALTVTYNTILLTILAQWIIKSRRALIADASQAEAPVVVKQSKRSIVVFGAFAILGITVNLYNAITLRFAHYHAWAEKHSMYGIPNHIWTGWQKPHSMKVLTGRATLWELGRWYAETDWAFDSAATVLSSQKNLWWQANDELGLIVFALSVGLNFHELMMPSYVAFTLVLLAQSIGISVPLALFFMIILVTPRPRVIAQATGEIPMFRTIHPYILLFFAAIAEGLVFFTDSWKDYEGWAYYAFTSWTVMPLFLCLLTQSDLLHRALGHFTYEGRTAHYAGMFSWLAYGGFATHWARVGRALLENREAIDTKPFDFIFGTHTATAAEKTIVSEVGLTISQLIGSLGSEPVIRYIAWDVVLAVAVFFAWTARRHLQPAALLHYAGLWPGHNPIRTGVQTTALYAQAAYNVVQNRVPILPGPLGAHYFGGGDDSDSDEEIVTEEDQLAVLEKEAIEAAKSGNTERSLRSTRKPSATVPILAKGRSVSQTKTRATGPEPDTPSKKGRGRPRVSSAKRIISEIQDEADELKEAADASAKADVDTKKTDESKAELESVVPATIRKAKKAVLPKLKRATKSAPRALALIDPDETELETAAMSWLLFLIGGLGMTACGVLGAELEASR